MMGSFKSNAKMPFTGVELRASPSTQSLGVLSNDSTIVFGKEQKKTKLEICLVVSCVLLLMACVVLAVLFALEIGKPNESSNPMPSPHTTKPPVTAATACNTADCLKIAAEFTTNMNNSINPCDDFFHYTCDGWIRNNPIPPSENEYVTFLKLMKENDERLRNLLEDANDFGPEDPVSKARNYYKSCMDEKEVQRTAKPQILELIAQFGSWALDNSTWNETIWDWKETLLKIQRVFADKSPLFNIEVEVDPKDSSKYLIKILPARTSLLKEQYKQNNSKTMEAFVEYMTKVGVILGADNVTAYKYMKDVLKFESQLAEITPSKSLYYERLHDTMTLGELQDQSNLFSWTKHLGNLFDAYGVTLNETERLNVPAPDYLANMTNIVSSQDNRTLSNYFIWTIISNLVPFLSTPFRQAEQDYKIKATQTKAASPRWLQCIRATNYAKGLTFATGKLWIEKVFDPKITPKVREMMISIRKAFRDELAQLEWIDSETRPRVYEKERAMIEKIGYPEMCVNDTLLSQYYAGLEVDDKRYLPNQVNVTQWYTRSSLSRLRKPVDRDSWYSGPQAVNAFYLRSRNEINVHAGILQPPFYHGSGVPRAVNFGGIGMVLAHELTHGFDSVGRLFNKYGEMVDQWWSNYTLAGFKNRSECLVSQYDKYPLDLGDRVIYVNGRLTLAENIADNGGLKVAYRAYENWIEQHGEEEVIPGLMKTNRQMFFVSYAQMWCSNFSPAAKYARAKFDTHTNPMYRVNGVVANSRDFAKAFDCPLGSKMNPKHKCRVW